MPSNKMERFTPRARRVLILAQEEAERLHHNTIDPQHLLLGLLREEGGVAGRVLRDLGLEKQRIEELVEEFMRGTIPTPNIADTTLELSAGTKHALELAVNEARRMGHHYIGTEHILLGLVRQSESVAIDVLKRLGVSPEEVRRQTRRVLQESPVQNQSAPPPEYGPQSTFSTQGGQVLSLAREYVDQFQLITVDPEHLLIGLMREKNGIAAQLMRNLGVEQKRVEELVEELTHAMPRTTPTNPELSNNTKQVLELALNEVKRLGDRYIDTQHLLLGLLGQQEGVAIDVLKRLGISPEEMRQQINLILQKPMDVRNSPPPQRPQREVQYIGAGSMYLMESILKKMLDMVGEGKLTVEQANEMLVTLQPGLKLNTGMQAWLASLVNQKEQQDKRHVRIVVTNRESHEEMFKLTLSLLEGLEKLDQLLLVTVPDNQLKSVAFESDTSPIRIEIHVENDEDKPDE